MNNTSQVTSPKWSLNLNDALRGIEFAVIGTIIDVLKTSVDAGSLNINFNELWKAAVLAGLSSLIHSWYSSVPKNDEQTNKQ
jgi:hypothetical protein